MAKDYTSRTLREIVRIVASRFVGILVIIGIVVGAVVIATVLAPKWYRSKAEILARPERTIDSGEGWVSLRDRVSLFVITQREIIMSDYVLASALMRFDQHPVQPGSTGPSSAYKPWYGDQEIQSYIAQNPERLRKFRNRISVDTPGGPETTFTQVFSITLDWPEERGEAAKAATGPKQLAAKRAHDAADCLVDAYLKRYTQLESEQTRARADFLSEERLRKAEDELEWNRRSLRIFLEEEVKSDLPLVVAMRAQGTGLEVGPASLTTKFQGEINKIDTELADLETLKEAVDEELNRDDPGDMVVPDAVTAANPLVTALQEKILKLKLQINQLEPRFTADYRELRNVKDELAAAQKDLHGEMAKQSQRLQQKINSLDARRRVLAANVAENSQRVDVLASKAARYEELQRKLENTESIYKAAKNQSLQAEAAKKMAEKNDSFLVRKLDGPSMPDPLRPRRPILWLNLVIALAGGFVLALAYAFLADHFDHTIKGIDEVERYLGTPVLASVPKLGRNIIHSE